MSSNIKLKRVNFDSKKVWIINAEVSIFFGNTEVCSKPKLPRHMEYNTAIYYSCAFVSMGTKYVGNILGRLVAFTSNKIVKFRLFDQRNLFMCQYLNLRGSSFVNFEV